MRLQHVCIFIYWGIVKGTHIFHLMRKHKNVELLLKTQNPCLYLLSRFPKAFLLCMYIYVIPIHVRTNTTKCHKYDYTYLLKNLYAKFMRLPCVFTYFICNKFLAVDSRDEHQNIN